MSEQLRINFFGAPARGKSNLAAHEYAQLRFQHYSAELVREWIKGWALTKRQIGYYDQLYVFGKQHHLEYDFLKAGVKNVVTDSPLWLSVFYAPEQMKRSIAALVRLYDQDYPALNILLLREQQSPYEGEGRYHDEQSAQELENRLANFLPEALGWGNYQTFRFDQKDEIHDAVIRAAIK